MRLSDALLAVAALFAGAAVIALTASWAVSADASTDAVIGICGAVALIWCGVLIGISGWAARR